MRTVTVRVPAARFSAAMAAMREWLDCNRYEPTKFKYDQDDEAVVLSVEFLNDEEGEAFAGHFYCNEPVGPTPPVRIPQGSGSHSPLVPVRERLHPALGR